MWENCCELIVEELEIGGRAHTFQEIRVREREREKKVLKKKNIFFLLKEKKGEKSSFFNHVNQRIVSIL